MTGLWFNMAVSFGSSQLPSAVSRDIRSFVAFVRACLPSEFWRISSSEYEWSMDADVAEKAAHSSAEMASSV